MRVADVSDRTPGHTQKRIMRVNGRGINIVHFGRTQMFLSETCVCVCVSGRPRRRCHRYSIGRKCTSDNAHTHQAFRHCTATAQTLSASSSSSASHTRTHTHRTAKAYIEGGCKCVRTIARIHPPFCAQQTHTNVESPWEAFGTPRTLCIHAHPTGYECGRYGNALALPNTEHTRMQTPRTHPCLRLYTHALLLLGGDVASYSACNFGV